MDEKRARRQAENIARGKAIGARVMALRLERGIEPGQLAAYAGVSKGYISRLEAGHYHRPGADRLERIARVLHTTVDVLLGRARSIPSAAVPFTEWMERLRTDAPVPIPRVDQLIHAGEGGMAMDYVYEPPRKAKGRKLVAGPVRGDCMMPLINDGDEVIVDLDASPRPGDVVVVLVDRERVEIKRLVRKADGQYILSCENPAYPETAVDDVDVKGVVIRSSRDWERTPA